MNDENAARKVEREYRKAEVQRRRLWPRAALVGFSAGLLALAFQAAAETDDRVRA